MSGKQPGRDLGEECSCLGEQPVQGPWGRTASGGLQDNKEASVAEPERARRGRKEVDAAGSLGQITQGRGDFGKDFGSCFE